MSTNFPSVVSVYAIWFLVCLVLDSQKCNADQMLDIVEYESERFLIFDSPLSSQLLKKSIEFSSQTTLNDKGFKCQWKIDDHGQLLLIGFQGWMGNREVLIQDVFDEMTLPHSAVYFSGVLTLIPTDAKNLEVGSFVSGGMKLQFLDGCIVDVTKLDRHLIARPGVVGIRLVNRGGKIVVDGVSEKSSASESKQILLGDEIRSVEFAGRVVPVDGNLDRSVGMIRGDEGSIVRLFVQRQGLLDTLEIALERRRYSRSSAYSARDTKQ